MKMHDKIKDNVEAFKSERFVTYRLLVDIVHGVSHWRLSSLTGEEPVIDRDDPALLPLKVMCYNKV